MGSVSRHFWWRPHAARLACQAVWAWVTTRARFPPQAATCCQPGSTAAAALHWGEAALVGVCPAAAKVWAKRTWPKNSWRQRPGPQRTWPTHCWTWTWTRPREASKPRRQVVGFCIRARQWQVAQQRLVCRVYRSPAKPWSTRWRPIIHRRGTVPWATAETWAWRDTVSWARRRAEPWSWRPTKPWWRQGTGWHSSAHDGHTALPAVTGWWRAVRRCIQWGLIPPVPHHCCTPGATGVARGVAIAAHWGSLRRPIAAGRRPHVGSARPRRSGVSRQKAFRPAASILAAAAAHAAAAAIRAHMTWGPILLLHWLAASILVRQPVRCMSWQPACPRVSRPRALLPGWRVVPWLKAHHRFTAAAGMCPRQGTWVYAAAAAAAGHLWHAACAAAQESLLLLLLCWVTGWQT